jgi:DNA-binding NtrC family response regulator
MECIQAYRWPGNVRQLRALCERWVIQCGGDALRADDLNKALQQLGSRPYRIKVTVGDTGAPSTPLAAAPASPAPPRDDEATSRALANPEVQRFREVFGGEIRKVRNLKE